MSTHSLVFDPFRLFADSDDSADALLRGQFDYRIGAPANTGARSLTKRLNIRARVKRLLTDPAYYPSVKCLFTDPASLRSVYLLIQRIAAIVRRLFTNPAYRRGAKRVFTDSAHHPSTKILLTDPQCVN